MRAILTILLIALSISVAGQTKSPFVYYKLDALSGHTDVSGNGYNAIVRGDGVGYDPIIEGYNFSGTNDYLVIPTVDLGNNFTFSFMAYTTQEVPVRSIMLFMGGVTLYLRIYIANNKLTVGSTGSNNAGGSDTWSMNTWHHVVAEIDKTTSKARLFFDGNYAYSYTDSSISNNFLSNDSLYIGVGASKTDDFYGNINEFMIFKNLSITSSILDSLYTQKYLSDDPLQTYFPVPGRDVRFKKGGIELKDKADPDGFVYFNAKKTYAITIPTAGINRQILTTDYDGVCPLGANREDDYDCAINDFNGSMLRKLKDQTDYASIVYIDPTINDPAEDGTIDHPYNSFSDVVISTNCVLLKRSTITTLSSKVVIAGDDWMIGAYGTGNKPVITTASNIINFEITGDNWIIRDIEVRNPYYNYTTTAAFQLIGATSWDIYNVDMIEGHMGVRTSGGTNDGRVIACNIKKMYEDGIYTLSMPYMEVAHTDIDSVNLAYLINPDMTYSSGDGIQATGNRGEIWIHHTSIDRGDFANKACIMLDPSTVETKSIIEYCTLTAPPYYMSGTQAINTGGTAIKIFKGNIIQGDEWNTFGIYSVNSSDAVINNVFTGLRIAFQGGKNDLFANNTFYDNDSCIYSPTTYVANEITNNIFYNNRNNLVNISATNYFTNFLADPLFINAASGNFHLSPTSDAINQGTSLDYVPIDIEGNERDITPDIGAYEYIP